MNQHFRARLIARGRFHFGRGGFICNFEGDGNWPGWWSYFARLHLCNGCQSGQIP